ncbi:MAG TPA: hemolysin family protein [Candidatus Binataceae bacterium]|nr:hemolysin family protein [Candidatus Binataceae bacterium]
MWLLPTLIALLLALAAFVSASETAVFSLLRIERLRAQLRPRVGLAVERLLARPLETLVTLIGLTEVANVFAECLATSLLIGLLGHRGAYLAVPINLVAIVLISDVTPKTLALAFPAAVLDLTAQPLAMLTRLLHPITGRLKVSPPPGPPSVSETEFRALLRAGETQGQVEAAERELIDRVFDFGGRRAQEIMTPREHIFALPIDISPQRLASEVAHGHYSRVPIYHGDLDRIVGVLHAKDLVAWRLESTPPRLERLLRAPYYVPPSKALGPMLEEMRHDHVQLALVVNEYGRLLGLVSLEDLLEELFGEIRDEFDLDGPEITPLDEGRWSVAGSVELNRLAQAVGAIDLPAGEHEPTLSRLLLRRLGRVPRSGERFVLLGFEVTVDKVRGASLERVTLRRLVP